MFEEEHQNLKLLELFGEVLSDLLPGLDDVSPQDAAIAKFASLKELVTVTDFCPVASSLVELTLKLLLTLASSPNIFIQDLDALCFVNVTGSVPFAALIVFALTSDNGQVPP